jgi:hypothetical protein
VRGACAERHFLLFRNPSSTREGRAAKRRRVKPMLGAGGPLLGYTKMFVLGDAKKLDGGRAGFRLRQPVLHQKAKALERRHCFHPRVRILPRKPLSWRIRGRRLRDHQRLADAPEDHASGLLGRELESS